MDTLKATIIKSLFLLVHSPSLTLQLKFITKLVKNSELHQPSSTICSI